MVLRFRYPWLQFTAMASSLQSYRFRNTSQLCPSLHVLGGLVGLRAEVGCGGSALGEVSRKDGLDEGAEDDLRAARGFCVREYSCHCLGSLTQFGEEPSTRQGRT